MDQFTYGWKNFFKEMKLIMEPGRSLPELDNAEIIPYLNVPTLTMVWRKDLNKTTYTYLEKSERLRLNVTALWENIMGPDVL